MRSFRTRLRVDVLEDRLTPVTAANLIAAKAQVAAGAAFFQSIARDPGWIFNSSFTSFVGSQLEAIFQGAESALTMANAASSMATPAAMSTMKAQAQMVAQQAETVGHWLGLSIAPKAPTPPAPKPTDAGMTNTMPSPTDPNWVPLGTQGLKTWDVVVGTGTPVATGDTITVFYTGWLAANGTKFDSRRSPAAPATFALSGLIQGFQQGALGMKPGGIRRLLIPSALGYGAAGSPPNIPPNADLVFEIKLISSHA
jgi:FKBP-type peptidyl-prolyl cis-trans isomerase FkpA